MDNNSAGSLGGFSVLTSNEQDKIWECNFDKSEDNGTKPPQEQNMLGGNMILKN